MVDDKVTIRLAGTREMKVSMPKHDDVSIEVCSQSQIRWSDERGMHIVPVKSMIGYHADMLSLQLQEQRARKLRLDNEELRGQLLKSEELLSQVKEDLRQSAASVDERVEELQKERDSLAQDLEAATTKLEDLQRRYTSMEVGRASIVGAIDGAERTIRELRSDLKSLRKECDRWMLRSFVMFIVVTVLCISLLALVGV